MSGQQPTIGRIVHVGRKHSAVQDNEGREIVPELVVIRPAIVTDVNEDGSLDLFAFLNRDKDGPPFATLYAEQAESYPPGADQWAWPPAPKIVVTTPPPAATTPPPTDQPPAGADSGDSSKQQAVSSEQ